MLSGALRSASEAQPRARRAPRCVEGGRGGRLVHQCPRGGGEKVVEARNAAPTSRLPNCRARAAGWISPRSFSFIEPVSRGKKQFHGHLLVEADLAGPVYRRFIVAFALFQRADALPFDAKFEYEW